jgi:hypothetical protein
MTKKRRAPRRQPSGHANRERARTKALEGLRVEAEQLGAVVLETHELEAIRRDAAGDGTRSASYDSLPPTPTESTAVLPFATRVAVIALGEVVADKTLEPVTRWRWIKDLTAVLGMTHAKNAVQAKLEEVARAVLPAGEVDDDEDPRMTPITPGAWDAAKRGLKVYGDGDTRPNNATKVAVVDGDEENES